MARKPCKFRQSDLTKAVKALLAAGLTVARAQISNDGAITVFTSHDAPPDAPEPNEWTMTDDKV